MSTKSLRTRSVTTLTVLQKERDMHYLSEDRTVSGSLKHPSPTPKSCSRESISGFTFVFVTSGFTFEIMTIVDPTSYTTDTGRRSRRLIHLLDR